jgi:hypothetical protein
LKWQCSHNLLLTLYVFVNQQNPGWLCD